MTRRVRALAAALALGLTAPAAGQAPTTETCAHRDLILTTARQVIETGPTLRGFASRRYGADAAYLLIRYGDIGDAAALALVDDLAARRVREADDLAAAFHIARFGLAGWLAKPGRPALGWLGMSARRAAILQDDGESFLRLLAEARRSPETAATVDSLYNAGLGIPAVLSDVDDGLRLRVARNAEAAGELVLAGLLLADRVDREPYDAFLARHGRDARVAELARGPTLYQMGVGLRHRIEPMDIGASDPEGVAMHLRLFRIVKAAYLDGGFAWLSIFLNQTGQEGAVAAADALIDAVASRRIDPVRDPEAGWAIQYRALIGALGPEAVRAGLGFDMPGARLRHFSGNAASVLDWVLAKDALSAFMRGEAPPPPRPGLLTDLDWERWTRIAAAVRDGRAASLGTGDIPVAVELLTAAGDWEGALFLAGSLPAERSVPIRRDLMKRLDRLCAAHGYTPGMALTLGGATLYRF